MTYIIVKAHDDDSLMDKVNNRIRDGWEPLGGVCFSDVKATWTNCTNPPAQFYQAMVKREDV